MFYDETCTVKAPALIVSDGEQVSTTVTVESGVPCAFYSPGNSYGSGRFAQRQGTASYVLVLPGGKADLAVAGRFAVVNGGTYVIESVQVHRYPSGIADNAECSLSQAANA